MAGVARSAALRGLVGCSGFRIGIFLMRYRHYSDRKPYWTELGEVLWGLLLLAVLDLAVIGISRWNSSRLWWALVWPLTALCVPLGRGVLRSIMGRMCLWQRPTLVLGNGPNAREAVEALQSEPALGFEVLDFVDVNRALQNDGKVLKKWAKVPGMQFVLALEAGQSELREAILRKLAHWGAEDVSVIPAMRGVPLFGTDISYFYSHEVAMLKLRNNLRYWPARLLKRLFDLAAALVLLVLLMLPFAYMAWLIRRDGGPAIFAHKRVGSLGVSLRVSSSAPCAWMLRSNCASCWPVTRLYARSGSASSSFATTHALQALASFCVELA